MAQVINIEKYKDNTKISSVAKTQHVATFPRM